MLGEIEDRRRRGQQGMRWLDCIINPMDMSLSKPKQGSLACCSPLGPKELDRAEPQNNDIEMGEESQENWRHKCSVTKMVEQWVESSGRWCSDLCSQWPRFYCWETRWPGYYRDAVSWNLPGVFSHSGVPTFSYILQRKRELLNVWLWNQIIRASNCDSTNISVKLCRS